jgi:hypothetical protein
MRSVTSPPIVTAVGSQEGACREILESAEFRRFSGTIARELAAGKQADRLSKAPSKGKTEAMIVNRSRTLVARPAPRSAGGQ